MQKDRKEMMQNILSVLFIIFSCGLIVLFHTSDKKTDSATGQSLTKSWTDDAGQAVDLDMLPIGETMSLYLKIPDSAKKSL